ncbi:MAG: hypothetical protein V4538_15085 [Bacteroidota bacterium]
MSKEQHELETVNWGVIPIYNYSGTLVEKLVGGYRVYGQTCNTPHEVDLIIMNACSILSESIYKGETVSVVNNGQIAWTNDKKLDNGK